MASDRGNQLTALCAVASFLWLAHNLEGHRLIEKPRLSSLLVLLIAGISSFAVSFFAEWLPGANGRFDEDTGPLRVARANLPRKPRRFYLPGLVACIILRLELFHRVTSDLQCSKPAIEACLPLVLLAYELLPGRRRRPNSDATEKDDHVNFGQTMPEAIADWLSEARVSVIIGLLILVWGTYLASSQSLRSTFFCSSHDSSTLVVFLQWIGVLLDGIIAVLYWRILAWQRTTKSRLKTLSTILLASSMGTAFMYWAFRLAHQTRPMSYHFKGLGSLYMFDVFVNGLTFATFCVSTGLIVADGGPLSLACIITFLSGLFLAIQQTWLTGTWENATPTASYFALFLICVGFANFVYANNMRSVIFVHRVFVILFLGIIIFTATIVSIVKGHRVLDNHPLQRLIYDARVEAGRWLVHASVSNSLQVAVQEYKERHNGRDPPPNFDAWFMFAKERKSEIMDHFGQMEKDILPFWGMAPDRIRDNLRRAAAEPGIAVLKIKNGEVRHNVPETSPYKAVMKDLAEMVESFIDHLPNMELAVNLHERPRVLAPWEDINRFKATGRRKALTHWHADSQEPASAINQPFKSPDDRTIAQTKFTSVRAFREMMALTCPPGTKARSGVHWDVRDFCFSCARPQSSGQYLTDWSYSQELCHQTDLLRTHSFHMTPPEVRPLQEFLPIFSRSKTDSYSDILIPLRRIAEIPEDRDAPFPMKNPNLFWRGMVDYDLHSTSSELFHGGHQERLVHLVNNASSSDKTTMLLPKANNKEKFSYEQVSTTELNTLLPMDVGFFSGSKGPCSNSSNTLSSSCETAASHHHLEEFGSKLPDEPLGHQYVLVMDRDNGPPPDLMRTLRSSSVPFYASIFKEWYSERLIPWVHFVPIDLRFHALHSTLAYFTGFDNRPKVNGREIEMSRQLDDAQWIAEQGKRWARKALRKEDMEVYLFRLLLEWGRVLDDNRKEHKFVLT
ncbi:glycosyltransferase family 90 protein [Podospora didyma]|uniref:Glycosyltransferase family 90 protein n=1 Tax=Podospora didyma TaxID=330526 RepID=A0AAE0P5J5_9PEZI|nr:glycosyltransferase family 90 protein [Podospora didyma]